MGEVGCAAPTLNEGIRLLQIDTLTPGNRYYIAVDNGEASGGNVGTFTLCTDRVGADLHLPMFGLSSRLPHLMLQFP